jgi:Carboxypeptidase regulatory-like domain
VFLASCLQSSVWIFLATTTARAQSAAATRNIQGTLTDPSGAVLEGAKVTIINGQSIAVTRSSAGAYNSGALVPGNYTVRAEGAGFKTVE